jgi:hypothetical protein
VAVIKTAISGHEMQSGPDIHQDSVKECDEDFRISDDSSVLSELSQGLLQGKLYLSKMNTHKQFVLEVRTHYTKCRLNLINKKEL